MKPLDLIAVLVAALLCIFGIILLIRILRNFEKERLDTWLGFIKFFLGTFVIGLLGFFAKLSYESRQIAVTESEQIGKYVREAMLNDLESRIRFAEYFSTVLPKSHHTGWDDYHKLLIKQRDSIDQLMDNVEKTQDSIKQLKNEVLDIEENEGDSKVYLEKKRKLDQLYEQVEESQKRINNSLKLAEDGSVKASATINTPDDFVTCKNVKELNPVKRTSKFKKDSLVYVHAFIQAPKRETITILWRDDKGEEWNKTVSNIGINMGRGYRLFDHVRPRKNGEFSVEMRNSSNEIIGFKKFIVE